MRGRGIRRSLLLLIVLAVVLQPILAHAAIPLRLMPDRPLDPVLRAMREPASAEESVTALAATALATTAAEDAYEAAGDDVPSIGIRDITANIWALWAPGRAYIENHTLDKADPVLGADEDWVSFNVDEGGNSPAVGDSVLIEAVGKDPSVSPVIEVFGPGVPTALLPFEDLQAFPGIDPPVTMPDPGAETAGMFESWFRRAGASAALMPEVPGRYYIRVRPYYQGDHGQPEPFGFNGGAGAYELRVKVGTGLRIAGMNRFETAVATSREMFASGSLAGRGCVVANGLGFADALAGSTLAGALRGPLLLTGPKAIPPVLKTEIARLGASTVYVLGGTAAVSPAVFDAIDAIPGVTAVRIAGANRYSTARAVSKQAYALLTEGKTSTAFVVSGVNFPDALSASPVAAYNAAPILLTPPSVLSPDVSATIRELGITDVVIVGGTAAVSTTVQRHLESLLGGGTHVRRIAGANRYTTSALFGIWATEGDSAKKDYMVGTVADPQGLWSLYPGQSGVASGQAFPDALAGGTMSGIAGCPLVLLNDNDVAADAYVTFLNANGGPQSKTYLFGGNAAMSDAVMSFVDMATFPSVWN